MLLPENQIKSLEALTKRFIDGELHVEYHGISAYELQIETLNEFINWLQNTNPSKPLEKITNKESDSLINSTQWEIKGPIEVEEKYAFKVSNALNGYILKEYSEDRPMVFEEEEIADESHIDQAVLKLIQYLSYEYFSDKLGNKHTPSRVKIYIQRNDLYEKLEKIVGKNKIKEVYNLIENECIC